MSSIAHRDQSDSLGLRIRHALTSGLGQWLAILSASVFGIVLGTGTVVVIVAAACAITGTDFVTFVGGLSSLAGHEQKGSTVATIVLLFYVLVSVAFALAAATRASSIFRPTSPRRPIRTPFPPREISVQTRPPSDRVPD
jgi:hypothetical protein